MCCFAPTAAFGLLHQNLDLITPEVAVNSKRGLSVNDCLRVEIGGKVKPSNGKGLVVISWGPDSKWVAKQLKDHDLDCTQIILCYDRLPNSLVSYFEGIQGETEVLLGKVYNSHYLAHFGSLSSLFSQKIST